MRKGAVGVVLLSALVVGPVWSQQDEQRQAEREVLRQVEQALEGQDPELLDEVLRTVREGLKESRKTEETPAKTSEKKGFLGVTLRAIRPSERAVLAIEKGRGVFIDQVYEESPASKAGLKNHDILLSVDGSAIGSPEDTSELIRKYAPGQEVTLEILRKGMKETFRVTLADASAVEEKLGSSLPPPLAEGSREGTRQSRKGENPQELRKRIEKFLEESFDEGGSQEPGTTRRRIRRFMGEELPKRARQSRESLRQFADQMAEVLRDLSRQSDDAGRQMESFMTEARRFLESDEGREFLRGLPDRVLDLADQMEPPAELREFLEGFDFEGLAEEFRRALGRRPEPRSPRAGRDKGPERGKERGPSRGARRPAWLGIGPGQLDEKTRRELKIEGPGVLIGSVIPDSPAERAGLEEMDYIVEVYSQKVKNFEQLRDLIQKSKPGREVTIVFFRDGKIVEKTVKLGRMPSQIPERPFWDEDQYYTLAGPGSSIRQLADSGGILPAGSGLPAEAKRAQAGSQGSDAKGVRPAGKRNRPPAAKRGDWGLPFLELVRFYFVVTDEKGKPVFRYRIDPAQMERMMRTMQWWMSNAGYGEHPTRKGNRARSDRARRGGSENRLSARRVIGRSMVLGARLGCKVFRRAVRRWFRDSERSRSGRSGKRRNVWGSPEGFPGAIRVA